MRIKLTISIFFLFSSFCFGQISFEPQQKEIPDREPPISSVYLDLLGNAYSYSLNFDYIGKNKMGFRIGITPYFNTGKDSNRPPQSSYDDEFSQSFLLTGMLNYYFGKDAHRLETGAGIVASVNDMNIRPGLPTYPSFTGTIGYRLLPNKEDIMIRVAFTPILSGDKFFPHFGFSIGYIF